MALAVARKFPHHHGLQNVLCEWPFQLDVGGRTLGLKFQPVQTGVEEEEVRDSFGCAYCCGLIELFRSFRSVFI